MISSTLDADVSKILSDKTHTWTTTNIGEDIVYICERCGKKRDDSYGPDGNYLPCKGFVS